MEKQYIKLNNITGWIVWAIATIVYISTIESTVSFWDCGEFIAAANKLQVGHPPGAPLWLMIARGFATFTGDVTNVAYAINVFSALCSSFTILFLFWSITALGKKVSATYGELSMGGTIAILASGIVGGLAYTFSDSFWFSASEAEVYAASSLFTAAVFWVILKWDANADKPYADRYLILVCYLMGLSIGVHILNLLALPALVYVYYFRRFKPTTGGFILTGIIGVLALGIINQVIISSSISWAVKFELFFVNSMSMPYDSGLWIFIVLILGALVTGLFLAKKFKLPNLQIGVLGILLILIGYSSYAMIVIRSAANPPMDENNPENILSLLPYLNREQYGDRPLLYGQTFASEIDVKEPYKAGTPVYYRPKNAKKDKYLIADKRERHGYNYNSKTCMVLPRMYSSQARHIRAYKAWSDFDGKHKIRVKAFGGGTIINKRVAMPTFSNNWKFFFRYQFNFMYWRYFMWNFSGRQNDIQGHGIAQGGGSDAVLHGNWYSGVPFIDDNHVGKQSTRPDSMKGNLGENKFYMLPLILGIIGLVFQFTRHSRDAFAVLLLFFMTGIAIIIYLNQTPYQPRERDYAYAGSFYAFAVWIGLGVQALYYFMKGFSKAGAKDNQNKDIVQTVKDSGSLEMFLTVGLFIGLGLVALLFGSPVVGYSFLYIGGIIAAFIGLSFIGGKIFANDGAKAGFALILTIAIPLIMGAEGWDDHTRNNRYAARDFAKNYLASCEKDAILFTNGDNDTFPLWYVQEVEGYRTDVRIVNLSLLNTDWYIDQMKRAVYKALPVPFRLKEDQYRQGTRDYVRVKQRWSGYADVDSVIDFVGNNKNPEFLTEDGLEPFFPTTSFSVKVDSAEVIKNGTVSPEFIPYIPKEIKFSLEGKGGLTKADMMIIDLLATNDWKRPVYFAVTVGSSHYMNLEPYFRVEGLAYRLTPINYNAIKGRINDGRIGHLDADKMYKLLMNEYYFDEDTIPDGFQWGNMNVEGVYVDEQIRRMSHNYRDNFARTAKAFIAKGTAEDIRKGVQLLDKCQELMPRDKFPYNNSMVALADAYFFAREKSKVAGLDSAEVNKYSGQAKTIMLDLATKFSQEWVWLKEQMIEKPELYLTYLQAEAKEKRRGLGFVNYYSSLYYNEQDRARIMNMNQQKMAQGKMNELEQVPALTTNPDAKFLMDSVASMIAGFTDLETEFLTVKQEYDAKLNKRKRKSRSRRRNN